MCDGIRAHAGTEVEVIVENLNVRHLIVKDDSGFDCTARWAVEVVRVATSEVAVQRGFAASVAGVEDLKKIEFTATGCPAIALGFAVLKRARDLSIEHPDSGHIGVVARALIEGHGEFKEEGLLRTAKAI